MKSLLKLNRAGSCFWFVVVVAIALSFSGCPPQTVPEVKTETVHERIEVPVEVPVSLMTLNDDIITRVGGIEEMQKARLFVSNVITMRLDSIDQEYKVEDEKVIRTSDIYADNVRIEPTYVGRTKSYQEITSPPYGFQFNVGFDEAGRNLVIPFVKQGSGANERYEISFTREKQIDVGGARYVVSFGGEDRNETPYLLFILEDRVKTN